MLCLSASLVLASDLPPSVPSPQSFRSAPPVIRILPNGLKLAVIERHELPIVTLRLVVRAGAEADPPKLPGTAQMVAALINQGTSGRSAQGIARTIDQVGGTIDTGADFDSSFISLSVLSDRMELAFDLVSDMALHPTFQPAELERQRKQALSALSVAGNDPSYVADAVFDRLVFAGTRYDHPPDGTEDAAHRMTAQDVRDFYAQYYRPANSILAVVGDIRPDDAFNFATRFFANWPQEASCSARERSTEDLPSATTINEPGPSRTIVVIDKPDAVQTEIRVGNRAIARANSDYVPLTVANQILGGPSANRLYKALRTDHGLTYSASSDLDAYQTVGAWEGKTFTRTSETMKAVRLVLDEMKRLRDHPISEADLQTAQSYLTGHMALEVESAEGLATRTLNLMVYDLPLDYWNHFPDELRTLQTEEVLSATRRYLDPERTVVVRVGNVGQFGRELRNLGDVRVIPIDKLDLGAPNLERASARGAGR